MNGRIHFGSLETKERNEGKVAVVVEKFHNKDMDVDLEQIQSIDTDEISKDKHQVLIDQLERKKIANQVTVPTDDTKVRNWLRQLFEPITLFGEGNLERRQRLKELIAFKVQNEQEFDFESSTDEEQEPEEEFYTYGIKDLIESRKYILDYSIKHAKQRLLRHKDELKIPFTTRKKLRHDLYTELNDFHAKHLQFGDDRPIGFCQFSPDSKLIATASWSGLIKLWNVPDTENKSILRGHRDRVSGLDFHPKSTIRQSTKECNLASGSVDGGVHLWSLESDIPIATLEGHKQRVARLQFHPSGRFVGTASFDTTWRLYDVETQKELLLQEGHARELFTIGFQNDGALCATGGYDSIGRIWDLRSGQSIMVLREHIKPILALDWSPNGYELATGGEDNTIRIWDIRAAKCVYTIPAHNNTVTQVKYWHANQSYDQNKQKVSNDQMNVDHENDMETNRFLLDGSFIISSSYDGTCKLWADGDYKPLKSLSGLEGRLMCCDISGGINL